MTGLRPDSLGLGIMRERSKVIGAVLSMNSKVGAGTEVVVVWKSGEGVGEGYIDSSIRESNTI